MTGQSSSSFVPSVSKTDVLLDSDNRVHKDLLLQQYGERIEKLSQPDRLSKICIDARFLNVVEIGQYFITKDCRILTIHRCSGLSWVHVTKRRRLIWTKRDQREHQNWTSIGSCNVLLVLHANMELRSESCPWTKTILTLGSEFFTAKTSWSRIWTTTSRKFQKFRSKNMRVN